MRCSARFFAASAVTAVALVPSCVASRADGAQASLPSALASFLTEEAHATPSEREALLAGSPLVKLLDADRSTEVAVFGAIWVNAPSGPLRRAGQADRTVRARRRLPHHQTLQRPTEPGRSRRVEHLRRGSRGSERLPDRRLCAQARCGRRATLARRSGVAEADRQGGGECAPPSARSRIRRGYRAGGNAHIGVYRDTDRPPSSPTNFVR